MGPSEPSHGSSAKSRPPNFLGRLSMLHVLLLVLTLLLAACGLVPVEDVGFAFLISVYIWFFNKVAFPPVTSERASSFYKNNPWFGKYITLGAVLGLLLPLGYIIAAFALGDQKATRAASPHLFLLSCQVLTEGFSNTNTASVITRCLVPISYNTWRLGSIFTWIRSSFAEEAGDLNQGQGGRQLAHPGGPGIRFGQILAIANMIFWSFNLFGFLLPVHLPKAMRKHFESEQASRHTEEARRD